MPLTQATPITVSETSGKLWLFFMEDGDSARVIMFGDRDKLVFQGEREKALAVYAETLKHYEARNQDEGTSVTNSGANGYQPTASAVGFAPSFSVSNQ